MTIFMTARFKVKPESSAKCEQAIVEFVDTIQHNEPDTQVYTALQEAEDSTSFLHVFAFNNEAARDRHSNSDAVNRFTSILYPECIAPVEFTEYSPVASNADFGD